MDHLAELRRDFVKTFLFTLLAFFLIPAATLVFVHHAEGQFDQQVLQQLAATQRDGVPPMYAGPPPSKLCADTYWGGCEPFSPLWQFYVMDRLSIWLLIGGVLVLLAILALGWLAFRGRRGQTMSLIAGRRLLMGACAVGVVLQGVMAVWLSYWLTAYFFERFYPKLIVLVGLAVAVGVYYVETGIFRRVPMNDELEGELLNEADAPALWHRVKKVATHLRTAPPDHIVAGIDTNFFVTEAPLSVAGQKLRGRTLYISIPLLRQMETAEADSVLTHELAHLCGGDTASSALLGPKLAQFEQYMGMMYQNVSTQLVFYPLCLFRLIFELAQQRDSRQREFRADRLAAKTISAQSIVHSLIRIAAYANYRAQIEQSLFEQKQQHQGALGIAGAVAAGLHDYARSSEFTEVMRTGNVPHPFDSHPALAERMRNVGYDVAESQYADIVTQTPTQTWLSAMPTAEQIEQRLWAKYEQGFAEAHEENLAWRYEPVNAEEEAVVLRHFPPVNFALKKGKSAQVSYQGITPAGGELIEWGRVDKIEYQDGIGGGDVLVITHPERGLIRHKKTKVKLPGVERDRFKETFGKYWYRHQVMRAMQTGDGPPDQG